MMKAIILCLCFVYLFSLVFLQDIFDCPNSKNGCKKNIDQTYVENKMDENRKNDEKQSAELELMKSELLKYQDILREFNNTQVQMVEKIENQEFQLTMQEKLIKNLTALLNDQQLKFEGRIQKVLSGAQTSMEEFNKTQVQIVEKMENQALQLIMQEKLIKNLTALLNDQQLKVEGRIQKVSSGVQTSMDKFNNTQVQMVKKMANQEFQLAMQEKLIKNLTALLNDQIVIVKVLARGCPVDNGYIFDPLWNICYKIFTTPVTTTGTAMKNKCSADGAEFFKITSQAIQDYIAKELGKIQESDFVVLIQGNDNANEGTWVFDDGSPLTYFNWYPGQPNGGTRDNVLAMNSYFNFKWWDWPLHDTYTFICVCQIPIG